MQNDFMEKDVFATGCGAKLTRCEPGLAELQLPLEERHMSHVGRDHVHAGVLYTLAESASAIAMLSYGYNSYAVEGNITYMDAASSGTITAVAKGKDAHTEESGSCRVRIYAEDGRMLAKAVFTLLYTGEPYPPQQ